MPTDGRARPTKKAIEESWDAARDLDAERAVLAACLLLGRAQTKPALTDGDFTDDSHKTLWKAMRKIRGAIDATILTGQLRDMKLYGSTSDSPAHVDAGLIAGLFILLPHGRWVNEYAARVRTMTSRRAALTRAEHELRRARP
jgi:replicative DNA helicase